MRYDTAVEVAAPVDVVWRVLEDVEAWPRWTPSMTSVSRTATGPLTVGETVRVRQPRLPEATWTVTAIDPGSAFTWVSRSPGVVTTGTHVVAPLPTGSRVALGLEQHGPLAGVVGMLLGRTVRRYVDQEAAGLKARVESD